MMVMLPKANNVNSWGALFDAQPSVMQEEEKEISFKTINDVPHSYKLIETEEDAKLLCDELLTFDTICLDTETTSIDAIRAKLVGLSFSVKKERHGTWLFHVKPKQHNTWCKFSVASTKTTKFLR